MSSDLSKLPCFIVDCLVSICDLVGVHNLGTVYSAMDSPGETICSAMYDPGGPVILLWTVRRDCCLGGTTYIIRMTGQRMAQSSRNEVDTN